MLIYNETVSYIIMRYVTSYCSLWCLQSQEVKSYGVFKESYTIIRLALHEDDHRNVYFRDENEEAAREERQAAWFPLYNRNPNAKHCFYADIPEYYRFIRCCGTSCSTNVQCSSKRSK